MKPVKYYLILVILPVVFLILSLSFRNSIGEFYLANNYDPSYVYLINALNLSQGSDIGHFDHPGTTVQETGAVIISITSLFSGIDKVNDVMNKPEYYLALINFIYVIMNCIALFILGIMTFKRTNNIWTAVILQLSPFFSVIMFVRNIRMSPEPLLLFIILVLIIVLVKFITETEMNNSKNFKYVIAFALICGFGLVTKISFFPVLIIPFILINRFPFKALFLGLTFISFLIFVFPAISLEHNQKFINWIKKIILHSGKYGSGERNIIDSSGFINNFFTIVSQEPVFILSYLLIAVSSVHLTYCKIRQKFSFNTNQKLLMGIFLTISLQIIIVFKHFELHYLLPAYILAVSGLLISYYVSKDLLKQKFNVKFVYLAVVIILLSAIQAIKIPKKLSDMVYKRDASRTSEKYLQDHYKNSVIISSYGVSYKPYAMHMGSWFGASNKEKYISMVRELYPDNFYFDRWSKIFLETDKSENIKSKLSNTDTLVFFTDNENTLNDFKETLKNLTGIQNFSSKKVFSVSTGESIYEIIRN